MSKKLDLFKSTVIAFNIAAAISLITDFIDIYTPPLNSLFNDSYGVSHNKSELTASVVNHENEKRNGYGQGLGFWDERITVRAGDEAFHTMGRMYSPHGQCTGTYVTIDGFEPISERPLVLTAEHCKDMIVFRIFKFDSDGQPNGHDDYNIKRQIVTGLNDIAIYELYSDMPSDVKPLSVKLDADPEFFGRVDVYGYSSDLDGLSADLNCSLNIISFRNYSISSNCDLYKGASGGAVLNSEGKIIAVNHGFLNKFFLGGTYHDVIREQDIIASGKFRAIGNIPPAHP